MTYEQQKGRKKKMVQVVNQIITYSSNLIDGENYRVHYRTAHA